MVAEFTVTRTTIEEAVHTKGIALIADAHQRALERHALRTRTTPHTTMPKLTEMQVGILAKGMNSKTFTLTKAETGKSSGYLVAKFLMKPVRKGVYMLTLEGRAAYEAILQGHAAALDITAPLIDEASGLNINDPALAQAVDTEAARWQRIAEERMKTLRHAETTIDELGRLNDQAQAEIKRLDRVIAQKDSLIEDLRRQKNQRGKGA